jgi:hypothetical protein
MSPAPRLTKGGSVPPPDPLDQADAALKRVRDSLKDATDDEVTGRHEITVNVNTAPQPSSPDLTPFVQSKPGRAGLVTAVLGLIGSVLAILKAAGVLDGN